MAHVEVVPAQRRAATLGGVRSLDIDPDIRAARTPPGWLYSDRQVWTHLRETLWARSWHLFTDGAPPAAPGEAVPWTLLPGHLDEPLLFATDAGGDLRCFANVCTHRGHLICPQRVHGLTGLRCRYHGRRFELDGRCKSAPGFDDEARFPEPSDHLTPLPTWRWGPLAFTCLDPDASPLEGRLGPWAERLAFLPIAEATLVGQRTYSVAAHWALYVDNYLEGLHIPFVHPALAKSVHLAGYHYETGDYGALQLAEARDDEPALEPPPGHPDHGRRIAAYYLWVFPGLMLNFYPWGLSVNVLLPRSPERTDICYLTWEWDASLRDRGAGADLDQVEREDQAVVVATAEGLRSRRSQRGRYEPVHEIAVHHFHRLLARHLPPEEHR